jgi:sugar phosphate isomerase/epimerase
MERKICINLNPGFKDVSFSACLDAIKDAGFDGVFTGWTPGDMVRLAEIVRGKGLYFQSVHAPFTKAHLPWENGNKGEEEIDSLIECIRECAEAKIPIVVVHPIIGMDRHKPTDLGIERFRRLVTEAEKLGITVAFENVEGIEYLIKIIADLGASPAVGYCWDTGHEMCYNGSMDVPALFGNKLVCTHLNDNLGQTDPKVITWLDDSHLMPFDGVADWQSIADRLARVDYAGELTFELTVNSKPGKNTHDIYNHLDLESYFKEVYSRAQRIAQMIG